MMRALIESAEAAVALTVSVLSNASVPAKTREPTVFDAVDQHNLTYADLKNEIGSKSLVSQILSGQRSLTISHIKALSARFGVKPEWFL